jgi:RNAse (barnase) inhibitor barstar
VTWQIAVVVDVETEAEPLLGMMPVWATSTPTRKAAAPELRKNWHDVWIDDSALTLWSARWGDDVVGRLLQEIPIIEMHHPGLACLRLFGTPATSPLVNGMAGLGYQPVSGTTFPGVGFARPIGVLPDVPILDLNAAGWNTRDDFYAAFFQAVGAPEWHGRNFDALLDSIQTGRINVVEVPYKILVANSAIAGSAVRAALSEFAGLVGFMASNGCPVSLTIQS